MPRTYMKIWIWIANFKMLLLPPTHHDQQGNFIQSSDLMAL